MMVKKKWKKHKDEQAKAGLTKNLTIEPTSSAY